MGDDIRIQKPRRRTKKALERKEALAKELMKQDSALSKEEALKRAHDAMRANPRADWRDG